MKKKILFDLGHPAHFHLFKNYIRYCIENQHDVSVVARDKDVLIRLLEKSNFKYQVISKFKPGLFHLMIELFLRNIRIFKLNRIKKFDLAIGTSISIAHISFLSKMKSYCFSDNDDSFVPFYAWLCYPFATKIINPQGLKYQNWINKRVLHNSFHDLAYLHINNFKPDINILNKYKLISNEYIVARFSAINAHHDSKVKGISVELWGKIKQLINELGIKMVISVEAEKQTFIDPWDMHHLLYFARAIVSDSGSMSTEAACLGVPTVTIASWVNDLTVIKQYSEEFELLHAFLPNQQEDVMNCFRNICNKKMNKTDRNARRMEFLQMKEDLLRWMISYFKDNEGV